MLPLGNHRAKAVDACMRNSRGKIAVEILFKVTDANGEDFESHFGSFSGGARQYTEEHMRVCGWDGSAHLMPSMGQNEVTLNIYEESYDGKMRRKTRIYGPRTELSTKEEERMSPQEMAEFFGTTNQSAGKSAPKAPREPGDDDEMPDWIR